MRLKSHLVGKMFNNGIRLFIVKFVTCAQNDWNATYYDVKMSVIVQSQLLIMGKNQNVLCIEIFQVTGLENEVFKCQLHFIFYIISSKLK